ncbi:hypothetical protein RN001_009770 [Aquatica leii]|uniref:Inner centromere protein ARK-binding domain-containing protein n=1 Tax=Aquatica leii TaxID=1421715 RepID=A0AAN7PU34_9COLE|nr:hypothetical protein RN001_009770 [Aquatica leii]
MSVHDELTNACKNFDIFVLECLDQFDIEVGREMGWFDVVLNDVAEFDRTGVLPQTVGGTVQSKSSTEPEVDSSKIDNERINVTSSSSNSLKENDLSNTQLLNSTSQRITRHAKKMVLSNVQQMHDNLLNTVNNAYIKMERVSEAVNNDASHLLSDVKVKKEMPPPQGPVVRNKRKKKVADPSLTVKSELLDELSKNNANRDSDVQIQNDTLPAIVLEDSIIESRLQPVRNTRTKKRKIEEEVDNSEVQTSTPIATEEPEQTVNETMVISKPTILNDTVVLEKATVGKEVVTLKDILTDDEDVVDDSPPRSKRQRTIKQVFSPYENSPVKKRVEAFEKLGATSDTASKVLRSKMGNKQSVDRDTTKTFLNQKSRLFGTPLMENRLRHLQTSSASKSGSNIPIPSSNTFLTANKASSGLKTSASQMEFRERELRRRQKEADALQKKEAMILAATEEKRKKREEREMKVQQLKIAKERNKQMQLEIIEKAKDEKYKQILAEKEAKLMKQKEEAAQKRAAAVRKVAEARKNDALKIKFVPPYLKYQTPLLPSPDCYDSDDSAIKDIIKIPHWQKSRSLAQIQKKMLNWTSLKKMFFLSGPRTPNLQEIFPTIEPSKLKRTSSAIWNKTEKSILDNLTEEGEYED